MIFPEVAVGYLLWVSAANLFLSLCGGEAPAEGFHLTPASLAAPASSGIREEKERLPLWLPERLRYKEARLALPGRPAPVPSGSYLWQPSYELDFRLRGPTRPYVPQPGDIVLSTDGSLFWLTMHNLAGTSHPTHSMIVFAFPDGRPGILEAGPHDTLKVRTLEALPHLWSYEKEGRVWVRQRTKPLTPEQSARLTQFALAVDGRDFALIRLGGQLTPLRSRGPLRTYWMGKPQGLAKKDFFCSELVVEACVYAGLIDPQIARPAATYPRDLFLDRSINLYLNQHFKLAPDWAPPARWTSWTPQEYLPLHESARQPGTLQPASSSGSSTGSTTLPPPPSPSPDNSRTPPVAPASLPATPAARPNQRP
jgi:hypothetical protein